MLARIADGEDKNSERLAPWKVSHHLGPVSCKNLRDFLGTDAGVSATNRLERLGVKSDNYDPIPSAPDEGPLTGKSFCVTGTLSVPRDAIHGLIKENGGNVVSGVSAKTDYLVAGDKAGSKIVKAEKLGITVLSESELRKMTNND